MTAGEKHREEQEEVRNARMNRIFDAAFELFAENGIDPVSMNEIAAKAEIGVASLYRYFSTKEDLAIEVAIYAWKKEGVNYDAIFSREYLKLTGYEQLEKLLAVFPEAVETQGAFFRFIYFFDSFIRRESVSVERLKNYEEQISGSRDMVVAVIEKGIADGSIDVSKVKSLGATVDEIYFTMTHSLFSLAQKLSLSGNMLNMDAEVPARKQVELLIKIILDSLR